MNYIYDELMNRRQVNKYILCYEHYCCYNMTTIMIIEDDGKYYINSHNGYFVELPTKDFNRIMSYVKRNKIWLAADYEFFDDDCEYVDLYRPLLWQISFYLQDGQFYVGSGNIDYFIPKITKLASMLFHYYLDVDREWFYNKICNIPYKETLK